MIAGEQNIRKQLYSHWFDRAQTDVGVIWGIRNTHSCVTTPITVPRVYWSTLQVGQIKWSKFDEE